MNYICLKTVKYIKRAGVQISYRPGDWLEIGKDVGKQAAMIWVAEGSASLPHLNATAFSTEASLAAFPIKHEQDSMGVVIRSGNFDRAKQQIPEGRLKVVKGGIELPFTYTLLWSPPCPLRHELLPIGFLRLTKGWQLAVP